MADGSAVPADPDHGAGEHPVRLEHLGRGDRTARSYGIQVQLDLTGDPPAFACGNKQPPYACDGYKPDEALFAQFVGATVAHFRGSVSRFSLWNEPNWYTWISPHDEAPILYRRLYQAGYKAAKAANPNAEIVIGEFAPHFQRNISTPPLQFIREMVCVNKKLRLIKGASKKCTGGPLAFDAFSTHPYDFTNRPTKPRPNPDELTLANINALPKLVNKLRKKGLVKPSHEEVPDLPHGARVLRRGSARRPGEQAQELDRQGVAARGERPARQADAAVRVRLATR